MQNVSTLKTVCSFKLGEQGSFQSAPLVYNGVLYMTSVFGTFAIDAASCKKRWSYQHTPGAHMGQRNNKGAAISNGRVIRGTPDGHLIALDAATGTLLWDRTIMDASGGEYATAVPLVWKDMIFIGKAGGDLGIRGEMMAFRAADGTKIWGFHTIPGSGETGSETWKNPASIAHGGGATWTSYSLDPVSGLLLLPVGNAGPDFDNEARPGTNLFTNSIVALDAMTGHLKWWHQLLGPDDRDLGYHDRRGIRHGRWQSSGGGSWKRRCVARSGAGKRQAPLHYIDRLTVHQSRNADSHGRECELLPGCSNAVERSGLQSRYQSALYERHRLVR